MKYKLLNKFLEGGEVTPSTEEQINLETPLAEGAEQQLLQVAAELVQQLMNAVQDPQAVAAILQMALEMVAGAAQEAQPTFQRNGGRIQRVRK